jgi:hypothetical protein
MPAPKVICSICGQEVNKAQTTHIGGGKRACRSHEGVVEAGKREHENAEQKRRAALESMQKKHHTHDDIDLKPRCMICNRTGMHQVEWFARAAIELKKREILRDSGAAAAKPDNSLLNIPCLYQVAWHNKNVQIKIPHETYEFTLFQRSLGLDVPVLLVCQECVDERGLITTLQERLDNIDPEMFVRIAQTVGAIMKSEVEQVAMREIIESN